MSYDGKTWGKKGKAGADYSLLTHPVYLPLLAKVGDVNAVKGIAQMASADSTQSLLQLMRSPDSVAATWAGYAVARRIPPAYGEAPMHGVLVDLAVASGQRVARGQTLATLEAIDRSGHKLLIVHSHYSMISSGKASAPMSSALIDGRGESVDIYFNFDIPDYGSHRVFNTQRRSIEYTAVQNLYHELAHAMHMMQGTWRYTNSERQAIEEENRFRRQQAGMAQRAGIERVFVTGMPICPEFPERIGSAWRQQIICY